MKVLFTLAAVLFAVPAAAAETSREKKIEEAMRRGADYAADILITQSGAGRTEYELLRGEWNDYETHWHTAQTIYGLLETWRVTGERRYLRAARRGGDWWISTEFKEPHPFAGLVNAAHGDRLGHLINMTTMTDGSNGIFALTRATNDDKYAQSAVRSGDWFLENAYIPEEGLFYNIADPETATVWKDKSPHHPEIGPAEIKVTEVARPNSEGYAYADMCAFTGDRQYCAVFLDVADKKLKRQSEEGAWMDFEPNRMSDGRVHPRFNIWLAEAQLEAYEMTGDRKYLESALQTGRLMAKLQKADGAFYRHLYRDGTSSPGSFIGSASAFSGILWLRLRDYGVGDEFDDNIERSVDWLLKNQALESHPDENVRGSFLNLYVRRKDGQALLYQRDIGTGFALRFLATYLRDRAGEDVNVDSFSGRDAYPDMSE